MKKSATIRALASLIILGLGLGAATTANALTCQFQNGTFRVSNGAQSWQKYITSASADDVKVACAADVAAAIAGPYFVFFKDGLFGEKFITIGKVTAFRVNANMAAAVIGPYFVAAKEPSQILSKFITTTTDSSVPIAVARDLAITAVGPYLAASDGETMDEHFVTTTSERPHVATAGGNGAAIFGSYFVGYMNGSFTETYVGPSDSSAMIAGGGELIAASMANYFIVLDGRKSRVNQAYIGQAGKVAIVQGPRGATALLTPSSGQVRRYDVSTGSFY